MAERSFAVVGAGVAGLSTAVALLERGARVVGFAPARAADGPRTASGVAPAAFTPYPGADNDRLRAWSTASFERFSHLARTDPTAGMEIRELREIFSRPFWTTPWLDDLLAARALPTPPGWHAARTTLRPQIDTDRYLPWLRARVLALGGSIQPRVVQSLDALLDEGFAAVVNCAGLGARTLASDTLVHPSRGQVVHVPNNLGLTASIHDDAPDRGEGPGLVAYVFVFSDRLVLGGSFEPGVDGDQASEAQTRGIIARCRELLRADGHPRWAELGTTVLDVRAAARPTRVIGESSEMVRLEAQERHGGRVVHNYGHGRSGITLSWGCAIETAERALIAAAGSPC
ncbi:MAG: FAD-dependent oxidoreductase [Phycisphaerales bacterium]